MGIKPVTTIQNQVYQALKQEICSGSFQPGQKLHEQNLAKQFQVSRIPIREALRKLVSDGLVEEKPNRGVFVRRFTPRDIEEIYEVRYMLESQAIENVVRSNNPEIATILSRTLNHLQNSVNDLSQYTEFDTQLHHEIVTLSGNQLLCDLYDRIDSHIRQFRRFSLTDPNRLKDSVTEHTRIVEAILAGDAKTALEVNSEHLLLARDQVMLYLRTMEPETE